MSKALLWIKGLVGNSPKAAIGIGVFILLLVLLLVRCSPAHADDTVSLLAGTEVVTGGTGPALGLRIVVPARGDFNWYAGTTLLGKTEKTANNWAWFGGIEGCRWRLCAHIGPAYLQNIDALNGAHTNYNLGLTFRLSDRLSLEVEHFSDAGTTPVNVGRNLAMLAWRLQ